MPGLITFFVILVAGLIFSEAFRRLHLPYVTALIVGGIIIGPSLLNIAVVDETILFLGSIGLIFLMFMAGSEIKMKTFKRTGKEIALLSVLNGIIPFLVGYWVGTVFGLNFITSIVLGIVFISSSVAVIIPSLERMGLIHTRLGETVVSATVFEDIGSLLLLAFILQSFAPTTPLPLFLYIPVIIIIIFSLKVLIPELEKLYHYKKRGQDLWESKLRFILVILIATVILFEFIGMKALIAGFIIGIILGDAIVGKVEEKIRTISYGIFIPTFFIIIGIQTDLSAFVSIQSLYLTLAIVFGLIAAKIVSGFVGGKLLKFSGRESLLIGFATTPQLSTTLAVAFVAVEQRILSPDIAVSLVVLSIVTTFLAPIAMKYLAKGVGQTGVKGLVKA